MDFSEFERVVTLGHSRVFVSRNIRGHVTTRPATGEAVMIDSTPRRMGLCFWVQWRNQAGGGAGGPDPPF